MTRLVIVGDGLLDRDVDGQADRLCPDAPAPVLRQRHVTDRPGGAGLAAVLAAYDGHEVTLVTALADDPAGRRLRALLAEAGVRLRALPVAPGAATAEKIRLRAAGQVLLRLDRGGSAGSVGPATDSELPDLARELARADAILVSDYGGGVTARPPVRAALAAVSAPVVWDPHPTGSPAVPGARLVTPNAAELARLADAAPDPGADQLAGPDADQLAGRRYAALAHGAHRLRRRWRAGAVAVTLGSDGALLCHAGRTPLVVSATEPGDGDSCGAGDRFAVTAAAALAGGALVSEAVTAAVREAGWYVRHGPPGVPDRPTAPPPPTTGTAPTPGTGPAAAAALTARVRAAGGTVVATGGCFDLLHAGHIATLETARGLGDCLVVCLNSDRSVAALKGPDRPVVSEADRARVLASLRCVDAVLVFDEHTPEAVLDWLRPDLWVKGGDYADGTGDSAGRPGEADLPEAARLRRWGGQAVIVPYLDGHSSSALISTVRAPARLTRATHQKGA